MFDSGISVKNLVEELKSEVDVALDIPNATYVTWLNSLQQMLYTEVIKEQRKIAAKTNNQNPISVSSIGGTNGENVASFEDIHAVYVDGKQLIKSTVASGVIFPDTFYKDNNNIGYNTKPEPSELTIVYFVKPELIKCGSDDVIGTGNVKLPIEFIDLAKAKLRGEAYKLVNEGDIAANWLNDYNVLLETFKAWIAEKAPNFGL